MLTRTGRALTQRTGQVAIVQYPSFARASGSHVEFVHLGGARVVVIVVTDTHDFEARKRSLSLTAKAWF